MPAVLSAAAIPKQKIGWLHDPFVKEATVRRAASGAVEAKRVVLNLDLPPAQRWTSIAKEFAYIAPAVIKYFEQYIPKWLIPEIETVAASIGSYFPPDYAAEMTAIAPILGLKLGDIVILNLIYQIEGIGVNCSSYNNTGPCPSPSTPEEQSKKQPGLCTSIVARDSKGQIFHARNLDWSIPAALRALMVDVEYQRNGQTIFIGSQPVGYMGILHGVKPGGWSFSLDARNHGGNVISNLLWSMLKKSLTPTQHARQVMETAASYDDAITALSTTSIVNAAYYIVGGVASHEAAVITRERRDAVDVWTIPTEGDFFLLQTNYDHASPAPPWDDRRTPGYAHMATLGQHGVGFDGLFSVLTQWPTFNHHTDFSASFSAANTSHYQTYLWPEMAPPESLAAVQAPEVTEM